MIEIETLKKEREELKDRLKKIEADSKEAEKRMREIRQSEVQTKREIEALTVLIDLQEARAAREKAKAGESEKAKAEQTAEAANESKGQAAVNVEGDPSAGDASDN